MAKCEELNFVSGFRRIHDASEMPSEDSNAWGVGDKDLFKAISAYMDQHRGKNPQCDYDHL